MWSNNSTLCPASFQTLRGGVSVNANCRICAETSFVFLWKVLYDFFLHNKRLLLSSLYLGWDCWPYAGTIKPAASRTHCHVWIFYTFAKFWYLRLLCKCGECSIKVSNCRRSRRNSRITKVCVILQRNWNFAKCSYSFSIIWLERRLPARQCGVLLLWIIFIRKNLTMLTRFLRIANWVLLLHVLIRYCWFAITYCASPIIEPSDCVYTWEDWEWMRNFGKIELTDSI